MFEQTYKLSQFSSSWWIKQNKCPHLMIGWLKQKSENTSYISTFESWQIKVDLTFYFGKVIISYNAANSCVNRSNPEQIRDDKAMEISQFIQSKINQSKLLLLYNPTVYPKWSWFPLVFIGPVRLAGFVSSWLVDTRIWIRKPFAAAVLSGCRSTTESNTGLSR